MLCGGIITFNRTHLPVRLCKEAAIIIILLNFYYMPTIAQDASVSSDGEGWYLQGNPVITKDEEIDLPPCYTGRTVTVSNGKGHGSQTYSADCFKDGSGTYSSDVTWTKPPAYMKPGSSISFSMKFTSPDENPTGGSIKAGEDTILEGSSTNPEGKSSATYTVPNGSPSDEMEIYTSFVMISGLHGHVTYKYKYQGAITTAAPANQPSQLPPSQTVSIPDTELPDLKIGSIAFFCAVDVHNTAINDLPFERSADKQSIQVWVINQAKIEAKNVKVQLYLRKDDGDTPLGDPVNVVGPIQPRGWNYALSEWDLKGQNVEDATISAEAYIPGQNDANEKDNKASTKVSIYYAKNDNKAFSWYDDTYSFENYPETGRETEEMVEGLLATVVGNIQGPKDAIPLLQRLFFPQTFIRFLNYTQASVNLGVGGHCYGMSATSGLYFQDSSLKPVPKATNDISLEEASTNINIYHRAQMFPLWESMLTNETFQTKEWSVSKCYQAVKNSLKNSREPLMISFSGKINNQWAAHAILAYKLIEVSGSLPYVYVYDPNFPAINVDQSRPMPEIYLKPDKSAWGNPAYMGYDWAEDISAQKVFREIPLDQVNAVVPELKKSLYEMIKKMKVDGQFAAIVRCPADAIFTDQQGRRTGILNGVLINEIPGAEVLSEGEVEIYKFPLDCRYSLSIAGTGPGELGFDIIRPEGENSVDLVSFQNVSVNSGSKITGNLDTGGTIQTLQSGPKAIRPTLDDTLDLTGFGSTASDEEKVGEESHSDNNKASNTIYDSWNTYSVDNNPTCSPFFTISEPQMITYIDTYHWNYGTGATGGTISLRSGDGTLYGPWEAETALDQGEVPRGYWIAHPNEVIPAGTYTVEDSDPDTWSKNSKSPCGFTKVEGYATTTDASEETAALATSIKEPVSSATSTEGISHQPVETETVDRGIEGKRGIGSTAEEGASDEETIPHSIDETISSAIKKSSTAAKQEPATIEKGTYSTVSAKPLGIRSQVATGDFEWNPQNFAGFYYDIDRGVGTEVLTAALKDGKLSGNYPYGLTYKTSAQKNDFAFEDWGSYNVMGFMGEKCFAGYIDTVSSTDDRLFEESGDENVLSDNELLKILLDDDTEKTITTDTPLTLEDGYMLSLDSVDINGNVVTLTLFKDGAKLITKKISPSKDGATMADKTFIYRKKIGNSRDVVIVAAHFENAFRGADQNLAIVDGIWQLSDEALDVSEGTEYDKMTIQTTTADGITMNNVGNDITLSRNKGISLMPGIGIKTADADDLRYYVYKEITKTGTYQLRGTVATDRYAWTADNFAGFYYDLDDDLETESLRTTITNGKLAQPDGVTYTTGAMTTNFEFEDWGSYNVIGFLGDRCFVEYIRGVDSLGYNDLESDSEKGYLFDKSTDKSALDKEQLLKILTDDDTEKTVTTYTPLKLEEGYELAIKSISPDGNKVYLELSKDGVTVDSGFIYPSQDAATLADKTYIYKEDVGDLKNMVLIAVHFKNAFRGADQNLATIDGVWQISNSPISVKGGASFGMLVISDIAYGQISMKNKDNPITLSKNKYVSLAGDIYLQTADSDSLRYCIVREVQDADKG